MQLFNSINGNMVLCVKKNGYILDISLDKYIINVLAYNHAIELVNTGAGTCFSTLDR